MKDEEKWTVILFFNRKTEEFKDLSTTAAEALISTAVFKNRDCIQFTCFKQT